MEKQVITRLTKNFEECAYENDGIEFWFARDLQLLLGYVEWRKFQGVIEKAKESCNNSGNNITDHFVGADKMVKIGSGAEREIEDIMLTRYACYLIAQNGDPRKQEIAFAQSYFAIQTRKQELIEDQWLIFFQQLQLVQKILQLKSLILMSIKVTCKEKRVLQKSI